MGAHDLRHAGLAVWLMIATLPIQPAHAQDTPLPPQASPGPQASPRALQAWAVAQAGLCTAAIAAAERRHGLPPGLLLAIAKVESGRPLPPRGALAPWPWTTDAEGTGAFYSSAAEAIEGARTALAKSRNLDVGCLQISLLHHPTAFATLTDAFDPARNADYAARFLRRLQTGPAAGDWLTASGLYHSQTAWRAADYRARVEAVMAGRALPAAGPAPLFSRAEQRGPIRFEVTRDGVRIVRLSPAPGSSALACQLTPDGGVACR